ncbi:MAG: LuxR C-terminal-related transcriptional regulator [Lachnospiraceae bacterium]|nr:LuxR C-terminal-related transcriptional regulator [Lachnospiraceae bacterium]
MENIYIKIPAIFQMLKKAEKEGAILYIHALGGFGKTAAVEYYFRRKPHLVLRGGYCNGMLDSMPDIQDIKQPVVIVDDIAPITDEKSQKYIRDLIENADKQLVLIGRTPIPKWIRSENSSKWILSATEKDLAMDAELTAKLLAAFHIAVTPEVAQKISELTIGHPVTISMVAHRMAGGKEFDAEVIEQVQLDLYAYCDHAFYDTWDDELKHTLFSLAPFERFTPRMLEVVAGCSNGEKVVAKALTISQAITSNGNGTYQMQPLLRDYLRYKQKTTLTRPQQKNIYTNAGLYYESEGDVENALFCYSQSDNQEKIADLLVQNAMLHPGNGHYFETRHYYLNLPRELIVSSPILMAGLSMLHSLLMQTTESEQWYEQLKHFSEDKAVSDTQRREAKIRLAYLDIALPHRGSKKVSEIFKSVAILCTNKSIKMPEFSVTSNLPSVMSGGKDFCEWSNNSLEMARMLKKPVELVLGRFGVGLVNVSLAESAFEKDSMDAYEIMSMLNSAYVKADTKGKPEMCFTAMGIMARVHISRGQPQLALSMIKDFREKMLAGGQNQLIPNIDAFLVWQALLSGNVQAAEKWLTGQAPNENIDFNILERYRYMIKIKTYIALGRLEEAATLTERMSVYCEEYYRNYNQIELGLLRTMIQYRMKLGDWKKSLEKALQKAYAYVFIRVVAEYGTALLPLLEQAEKIDVDKTYLKKIIAATKSMAKNYPAYLVSPVCLKEPLTETEKRILALLCTDATIEEIANSCDVTYNTVRYHNKNIYRKLDVENRGEARLKARQLGLEDGLP